jgi:hypothetical protein
MDILKEFAIAPKLKLSQTSRRNNTRSAIEDLPKNLLKPEN